MGTSTIDGTIESAVLKRARRNVRQYESIVFKLNDGSTKTWTRAVVEAKVAERLLPGTSGRFYLFTAIDHRGIHGVRDDKGNEAFGFARVNETAMLWVTALAFVWVALTLYFAGGVPIIGTLILILGLPAWFLYRKTRLEAERQFQADSGFRPAAALSAPATA